MQKSFSLGALLLILPFASCALFTGPEGRRVVGIVEWTASGSADVLQSRAEAPGQTSDLSGSAEAPVLEAPDTATAGVPFEVIVNTYGADGCWRAAGAEITATGSTAEITPYDIDANPQTAMCIMAVRRLPRSVRISFSTPGEGLIRVTGRRVVDDTGAELRDDTVTIEKRVVVR